VDDAPLVGWHWLQRNGTAFPSHSVGGAEGHAAQRLLPSIPVVLDIHHHSSAVSELSGEARIKQELQASQGVPGAADQQPDVFSRDVKPNARHVARTIDIGNGYHVGEVEQVQYLFQRIARNLCIALRKRWLSTVF